MLVLWTEMVLKSFCWLRSYPTFSSGNDALLWTWRLQSNPFPSFLIGGKRSQYLGCTAFPQNKIWLGSQVLPFLDNTLRLKDTNNSWRWDETHGQKIWNSQKQQPGKLLWKFLLTSSQLPYIYLQTAKKQGLLIMKTRNKEQFLSKLFWANTKDLKILMVNSFLNGKKQSQIGRRVSKTASV